MILFFKNKKTFLIGIACGAVVMFVLVVLVASFWDIGKSANYTFLQTAWNSVTSNTATHASNQTGWTEYSAKDSNVTAGTDITLATSSLTATDDGTLTTTGSATGGGFGNGSTSSTTVSGSGASGAVTLTGSTTVLNKWATPLDSLGGIVADGGHAVRSGSEDAMYILAAGSTTSFYKLTPSTGAVATLASLPGAASGGARLLRNQTEDYIYATQGSSGSAFYRYSISGNSWTTLTSPGVTPNYSSQLFRADAEDSIYFLPASGASTFKKYSISGNSWSDLTSAPGALNSSGAVAIRNGTDNDVYVLQAGGLTGFYKYSISGNSWTTLTVVPAAPSWGAGMLRDGSSDDIYVLQGGGNQGLYKYSISGNSWTTLATVPTGPRNGAAFLRASGSNDIYISRSWISTEFWKYSISGNSFTTLTALPAAPSEGATWLRNGTDNDIYVIRANSTATIYKYSISGNSWVGSDTSLLTSTTDSIDNDSVIVRNGTADTIYFLRANSNTQFYSYSVSGNSWTALAAIPAAPSGGAFILPDWTNNYLYVLRGNGGLDLYRYNISGNTWTTLTSMPTGGGAGVGNGSFLIRNGSDDLIYAAKGNGQNEFYSYSISGNSWNTLATTPAAQSSGGRAVLENGVIYVSHGNNATNFSKYTISGGSWTALTANPNDVSDNGLVGVGSGMVHATSEDAIYLSGGRSKVGLYKYSISGNSWTTLTAVPGSVGGCCDHMHRDGTSNDIYMIRGNGTANLYKYSISGNSWTTMNSAPSTISGGTSSVFSGNDIYVVAGGNTKNFYKFTIQTTTYSSSGTFESATVDLAFSPVSFGNLTWTSTVPAQTGANAFRVQVAGKTADSGWASGDYVGTDGTNGTYFTSSGTAIPSGLNGKRYVRYKVFFATADTGYTPTLSDITAAYNGYINGTLTSNIFNTQSSGNVMNKIAWNASGTSGTETIKFQIRSSSDGSTWSSWCGYADTGGSCSGSNYFESAHNNTSLGAGHLLNIGANDQYFQYKLFLASGGSATPTLNDVTVTYTVNASPIVSNVTASQASDGVVNITYDLADADNSDADSVVLYQPAGVTLNEELSSSDTTAITVSSIANLPDAATILIDNEQITYTSKSGSNVQGTITRGVNSTAAAAHSTGTALFVKAVTTSGTGVGLNIATGTGKSIAWTANTDVDGLYGSVVVKVLADDGEAGNRFGSGQAGSFTLDTKDPTGVSVVVNASKATANTADLTIAASDDNAITMRVANTNSPSGEYETYATSKTDYAVSGDPATVYLHIKDAKGNITTVSSVTPTTPTNLALVETSNTKLSTPEYRLFVSWQTVTAPTPGFANYKVYRKVGSGAYALATTITDRLVNYYSDASVSASTQYTYYVITTDSSGNVSQRSSTVAGTANGRVDTGETAGSDDQTAPTISTIGTPEVNGTNVTITFQTNETSDSWIDYSTNLTYNLSQGTPTMVNSGQTHTVLLTGLNAFTKYYFQVRSKDASGNSATENSSNSLTFTTTAVTGASAGIITVEADRTAPTILIFDVTEVAPTSAVLHVRTDEISRATLAYGTSSGSLSQIKESDGVNSSHRIQLVGLKPSTKYFVKADVADTAGNKRTSEVKNFTTVSTKTGTVQLGEENPPKETLTDEKIEEIKQEIQDKPKEEQKEILMKTLSLSVEVPSNAGTREDAIKKVAQNFETLVKQLATGSLSQDPGALQELIATASQEIPGPQIVEGLPIIELTSTSAMFYWKTDKPSNSLVAIVPDALYASSTKDPYIVETGNSREYTTEHTVKITDLRSATKYHYQLRSQGAVGEVAKSRDYEFITPSEKLEIIVANVTDVTASRVIIEWRTNVDADGQVEYTPYTENTVLDTARRGVQGKTDFSLDHKVELVNLSPGTRYALRIISRDRNEKAVERAMPEITTLIDREGPQMSQIDAQSTLYPGAEARVQTLVTWRTDEPSKSQVLLWEGLGGKTGEEIKTEESREYTRNHVVVLTRQKPGQVYQYKAVSVDESGNRSESDAYTMLAATNTENVIDVIVKNFSDIFGWLKKR